MLLPGESGSSWKREKEMGELRNKWGKLLEIDPYAALVSGLYALEYPADAVDAVLQIGVNQAVQGFLVAAVLRVHSDSETGVQVAPGIDQAGVVQCAQALVFECFRIEIIHSADQSLTRLALYLVVQLIRVHIVPLEGSLGADDADVLAAHVACVNCGCPHTANCAVLVTHQDVSIVLQRCAGLNEALAVAQQLLQLQLRADQLGHVEGVSGQVAEYEGRAGLVTSVVDILDQILPEGTVVYTEDKYGKKETYTSDASCIHYPMAVLVNGDSASASEIFAGAIKDYDYGTLIGTKTFGKGIVQTVFPLENGDAIKITTAKYYTPKGHYIHGKGIQPDIKLEYKYSGPEDESYDMKYDNQLQKAISVVKEKIN